MSPERILIVKTSSLGDVIHAFPTVTDLHRAYPDARIEWLVEDTFAALPALHPAVNAVIPSALRRWRKRWFAPDARAGRLALRERLIAGRFDVVLDLQGLLKSVWLARPAAGLRVGFDWRSAREPLAALGYQRRVCVDRDQHATERCRQLAALGLGYPLAATLDYGLGTKQGAAQRDQQEESSGRTLWAFTATSNPVKCWPEAAWRSLLGQLAAQGWRIALPSGSPIERARAERIAQGIEAAEVLPPQSLAELAPALARAHLAIGVDTGLLHLAAALGVPCIGLYVATDPARTGAKGGVSPARNLGGIGAQITPEAVLQCVSELC